jgi:hypothetical protein
MLGESTIKLKLSVWRDFVPSKALVLRHSAGGAERDHHVLSADSNLQQEVYSWQMREDPFSGISDVGTRLRLRELLLERFDAARPPRDRRITAMREFLEEAAKVLDSNEAEWTISQDPPMEDEESPYRLNPLLALTLHLEWLLNAFAEQPGVSVSIR